MKQGIEWQVSNLELSQKLKELGVKQGSLFYWIKIDLKEWEIEQGVQDWGVEHRYHCGSSDIVNGYSAYTVAELGEMLPEMTRSWNISNNWLCVSDLSVSCTSKQSDTEADARALMLIYLLENELITL